MKLHCIWIMTDGETWLLNAWDEYTRDENSQGYEDAFRKACDTYGAEYVRVQIVNIPANSVDKLFEIPEVEGVPQ